MSGPRSYGGESAHQRTARRRRQLLDAGRHTFGSVGFRASTVRGICRDAHVADRYFYELFPTLEDLLVAVYLECIDTLTAAVMSALDDLSGETELFDFLSEGVDGFFRAVEDPLLARVVWLEVLGVSPRVDGVYVDAMRGFRDLIIELLVTRSPDVVVDSATEHLATAAVGGMSHSAMTWHLDGYVAGRSEIAQSTARFLVAIVGVIDRR
ncbi:MAG: TetR/AcrR family transcriptional regulator [Rhodococcus sp. (in: high G+C Gram-positive bacteria)]